MFLEGLLNKNLYANLCIRKHKTLNECIKKTIDMDNNCNIYGKDKPIMGSNNLRSRTTTETEQTKVAEAEAMVDLIMERMNQVFRPPPIFHRCKACGEDHPTNQCLSKQNYQAHKPPRMDKWCDFERMWTNHETA